MVVGEPSPLESPRVELFFESINDQRLASDDYVQKHELLKLVDSILLDRFSGDAVDILEVVGLFDYRPNVKVWRQRLEGRVLSPRWHICTTLSCPVQRARRSENSAPIEILCDATITRWR